MDKPITIIGAGLAGSEAALQLAARGHTVRLFEMRPAVPTPVHKTDRCAELVCSNSLKSMDPAKAAGMLKQELEVLGSELYQIAQSCSVPAGGALAVDRDIFSAKVTEKIAEQPCIKLIHEEATSIEEVALDSCALVIATGPLTSDKLAADLSQLIGCAELSFYDAAAPIIMADSLDETIVFRQSRYDKGDGFDLGGDYLNAPFTREEYDNFIHELLAAKKVVSKDFETRELFQACQPIEEIARSGHDAPRFGPLKPVGLTDPRTGKRPHAVLQLRAENIDRTAYNLVGFQTNLTFSEQRRVFRLIPGLEHAEFARYGVMHRNTFIDAPHVLDSRLRVKAPHSMPIDVPIFMAGQVAGTEGYCEAIRSGLQVAFEILALLEDKAIPPVPRQTAFGALLAYATDPETKRYQPMHVNFGILPALSAPIRNKKQRGAAYAQRGAEALESYRLQLWKSGIIGVDA